MIRKIGVWIIGVVLYLATSDFVIYRETSSCGGRLADELSELRELKVLNRHLASTNEQTENGINTGSVIEMGIVSDVRPLENTLVYEENKLNSVSENIISTDHSLATNGRHMKEDYEQFVPPRNELESIDDLKLLQDLKIVHQQILKKREEIRFENDDTGLVTIQMGAELQPNTKKEYEKHVSPKDEIKSVDDLQLLHDLKIVHQQVLKKNEQIRIENDDAAPITIKMGTKIQPMIALPDDVQLLKKSVSYWEKHLNPYSKITQSIGDNADSVDYSAAVNETIVVSSSDRNQSPDEISLQNDERLIKKSISFWERQLNPFCKNTSNRSAAVNDENVGIQSADELQYLRDLKIVRRKVHDGNVQSGIWANDASSVKIYAPRQLTTTAVSNNVCPSEKPLEFNKNEPATISKHTPSVISNGVDNLIDTNDHLIDASNEATFSSTNDNPLLDELPLIKDLITENQHILGESKQCVVGSNAVSDATETGFAQQSTMVQIPNDLRSLEKPSEENRLISISKCTQSEVRSGIPIDYSEESDLELSVSNSNGTSSDSTNLKHITMSVSHQTNCSLESDDTRSTNSSNNTNNNNFALLPYPFDDEFKYDDIILPNVCGECFVKMRKTEKDDNCSINRIINNFNDSLKNARLFPNRTSRLSSTSANSLCGEDVKVNENVVPNICSECYEPIDTLWSTSVLHNWIRNCNGNMFLDQQKSDFWEVELNSIISVEQDADLENLRSTDTICENSNTGAVDKAKHGDTNSPSNLLDRFETDREAPAVIVISPVVADVLDAMKNNDDETISIQFKRSTDPSVPWWRRIYTSFRRTTQRTRDTDISNFWKRFTGAGEQFSDGYGYSDVDEDRLRCHTNKERAMPANSYNARIVGVTYKASFLRRSQGVKNCEISDNLNNNIHKTEENSESERDESKEDDTSKTFNENGENPEAQHSSEMDNGENVHTGENDDLSIVQCEHENNDNTEESEIENKDLNTETTESDAENKVNNNEKDVNDVQCKCHYCWRTYGEGKFEERSCCLECVACITDPKCSIL